MFVVYEIGAVDRTYMQRIHKQSGENVPMIQGNLVLFLVVFSHADARFISYSCSRREEEASVLVFVLVGGKGQGELCLVVMNS